MHRPDSTLDTWLMDYTEKLLSPSCCRQDFLLFIFRFGRSVEFVQMWEYYFLISTDFSVNAAQIISLLFFALCCILDQQPAPDASGKRKKWEKEEQQAVRRQLGNYISINKVPGKMECLDCISTEPEALGSRTWRDIKNYIHNTIMSKKRKRKQNVESDEEAFGDSAAVEPAAKRPRRKRRRRRRFWISRLCTSWNGSTFSLEEKFFGGEFKLDRVDITDLTGEGWTWCSKTFILRVFFIFLFLFWFRQYLVAQEWRES